MQDIPLNNLLFSDRETIEELLNKENKRFYSIEAAVYVAEKYPEFVKSHTYIFLDTLLFHTPHVLQKYLVHSFAQNKNDAQYLIEKIITNGYIDYNYRTEEEIRTIDEVIDSLCRRYGKFILKYSQERKEELRKIIGRRENIGIC